jgi:hypothetical protein
MPTIKEYRKLPGTGTRFEGSRFIAGVRKSCTLWLAADHLLMIFGMQFIQEFKRFYLRDIQALTVRKTDVAKHWTIVLGVLTVLFGVLGFVIKDSVGSWILWSICAFFGIFASINAAKGPSCIVEIKTAVQTEELSSLKRLRHARKTISILRPLIDEAQGKLTAEEIITQTGAAFQRASQNPETLAASLNIASTLKYCSGRIHQILFSLLLFVGLLDVLHFYFHPLWLIIIESMIALSLVGLTITALIKQSGTDVSAGLRRATWITSAYLGLSYLIAIGEGVAVSASNPTIAQDELAIFQYYSELNPLETPWLFGILIFTSTCSILLGFIGFVFTRNFREQKNIATAPPTPNINSSANP